MRAPRERAQGDPLCNRRSRDIQVAGVVEAVTVFVGATRERLGKPEDCSVAVAMASSTIIGTVRSRGLELFGSCRQRRWALARACRWSRRNGTNSGIPGDCPAALIMISVRGAQKIGHLDRRWWLATSALCSRSCSRAAFGWGDLFGCVLGAVRRTGVRVVPWS